jgi:RNA polymerase sigma-70 factor, ECF subfamily
VQSGRVDAGAQRPEDPDLAAIRDVLAGDVEAFSGIVNRWQGRLLNLAWRFCRDRSMAEDMAQEAFVKAFRALGTYRREAAFSTWLTAVAMNSYRTFLHNRPPQSSAIRRLVLTLPRRYREPLVLFYFQEMNITETSRVLGIPEGTLKARLHRGRELLRRRLNAIAADQVPRGRD